MTLGAIVTITNPILRQDKYLECITCLKDLCDEVVVVDGGSTDGSLEKITGCKIIHGNWPYEWNWIELPRHLNIGREALTTDWCLKIDIDQFFHEKDFKSIRDKLAECPKDCQVATFQKMSLTYNKKYYQKGGQPIAFRNKDYIKIGKNLDKETDLCFAIRQTGTERVYQTERYCEWNNQGESLKEKIILDYNLPVGKDLVTFKTGIQFWNYDYFFKTRRFTKREFWRFSRAYHRYFNSWEFGSSSEKSFVKFLEMMKGRYNRSPYTYKLEDHPKYIREAVKNLTKEQFGFNAWGLV